MGAHRMDPNNIGSEEERDYPLLYQEDWLRENFQGRTYEQLREIIGCSMRSLCKAVSRYKLQGVSAYSSRGAFSVSKRGISRRIVAVNTFGSLVEAARFLRLTDKAVSNWYYRHRHLFSPEKQREISAHTKRAGKSK
ncbi:MAG: hypothetical protein A2Y57_01020 [Candidatus Woykebacteria bacterium RBG_13_40_7b]|uniref:Uncharacterized protein n=1 Tax=Candidatus Woykebacteria bacterium RBG_13_40_7b TaxID=1802594 RepID=A0A1G1WAZ6_9BACT|nr:MAG: hypothetical protein A2Y57_01020 [Candidatus Woykebacteria bacterium RBG_13_40_7b]